jgi:asparagine synthase (glutamine-hydrolysing)
MALAGNLAASEAGVFRLTDSGLRPAGLQAVTDVARAAGVPLAATAEGLYELGNGWLDVRDGEFRLAAGAPDGRAHAATADAFYGRADGDTGRLSETADRNPVSLYARLKIQSERVLLDLADDHFSPTFLRNATAYGVSPRLRFDLVLNNLVAWAFTTGKVMLKSDGQPWRPIVHIEDISRAFLAVLEAPRVDPQGVSDLLLMGHMWSDTTLLDGVSSVHPATLVEYHGGELTERRYWRPDYDPAEPTAEYFHELTTEFQRTVDRTANTVSGDVGIWLSGGLDSRATVSEFARVQRERGSFDSLATYTYDANPGGGINVRLADAVAETLELPNETVPLTADRFLPVLEKTVDATDGLVNWNFALNLTATDNIDGREPNVLMEGIVGELVGQHLSRYHLREASSLVDSMYHSEASLTTERVRTLLDADVDPMGSYRREAARTDETDFEQAVVDTHFQNYYPRLAHASNPVARGRSGTRVPYADGEFLETAARLPPSWRMGALPGSDGELIFGVVKPKIEMIRSLDADLAEIPYERSRLKPSLPYPLHVAGFFASTALSHLLGDPTYGSVSMAGQWYRNHEGVRARLDDLLDDARERWFLDGDAVEALRQRHLGAESDETAPVCSITTIELWLQRHFD